MTAISLTSAPQPRDEPADQLAADSSSAPALELENLTKSFASSPALKLLRWRKTGDQATKAVRAVDGITLRVARREIYGILGANGSGKSTLIRLISTLLLPDGGQARVFGFDVQRDETRVKRLINRVSVEAAFFKKLSAMENLTYAARLYGLEIDAARRRAIEILGQLGLSGSKIWEPLEHLSRGMQQKVAIARAFLTAPVLLLMDEPTTGLDPRSKRDVQQFLLRLRDEHDATIVLTTHDMEEADRLCDRIAIIDGGRIVAEDTPAGLKRLIAADEPATLEQVFLKLTGRTLDEP